MTVINRYKANIKGSVIMFGNTLCISPGPPNTIWPSNFTVANVDPPGGGKTTDWQQNSSAVIVSIPNTGTIKYAELNWGGTSQAQISGITTTLNANISINLKDPLGTIHTINPDPNTFQEVTIFTSKYYTHSVEITNIIKNTRDGKYTVSGLPAVLNTDISHCGFAIIIIYEDSNEPFRNINLWSTNEYLSTATDVDITNFSTPLTGPVTAKLILISNGGQPYLDGESVKVGPSASNLITLSGPNNPANNFFCSQINNNDGLLDTTGTFGNNNCTNSGFPKLDDRINYDCTRIDASAAFFNNQTSARINLTSSGDIETVNVIALQFDIHSADITVVNKSVNKSSCFVGEELTYTATIKNSGLADAENVKFISSISQGTSFVSNSLTINGTPSSLSPASPGISLGTLNANNTITVLYKLLVNTIPNTNPFSEEATFSYEFTSATGLQPQQASTAITMPQVEVIPITDSLETKVYLSKEYSDIGDEITYTVTAKNTGNVTLTNIVFKNTIPNPVIFSTGTVTLNGTPLTSASPITGINISSININEIVTITFKVSITN